MYSYAAHLRSGTYHQLPLTTHANQVTQIEARRASLAATALDEEIESHQPHPQQDRGRLSTQITPIQRRSADPPEGPGMGSDG